MLCFWRSIEFIVQGCSTGIQDKKNKDPKMALQSAPRFNYNWFILTYAPIIGRLLSNQEQKKKNTGRNQLVRNAIRASSRAFFCLDCCEGKKIHAKKKEDKWTKKIAFTPAVSVCQGLTSLSH